MKNINQKIKDAYFPFQIETQKAEPNQAKLHKLAVTFARKVGTEEEAKPYLEKMARTLKPENSQDSIKSFFDIYLKQKKEDDTANRKRLSEKIERRTLIDKHKNRLSTFSSEALDNAFEKIVVESNRVFGLNESQEKTDYTNEQIDLLLKENEIEIKRKKFEEEEEEILNEFREFVKTLPRAK